MKTTKDVLEKFISLIHLTGAIELKECLMEGTKKSLKVCAVTPSKTFALKAELKGDYSDLGIVGIDDLNLLEKTISLMNDIDLTKKDNTLMLKGKAVKNKLLLRSPQYILTKLEEEKYNEVSKNSKGNEFVLTQGDITKIYDYYSIFKSSIILKGDKNEITIILKKGENTSELKLKIRATVKPFESLMAGIFVEALKNIDTEVKVSVKTDLPVIIEAETENYKVEYFIASLKRTEKNG